MPDQKALLFNDRISSPSSTAMEAELFLLGAPPDHGACQAAVLMESEAGWSVLTWLQTQRDIARKATS